jgi:molybdopterin molybdotransferase
MAQLSEPLGPGPTGANSSVDGGTAKMSCHVLCAIPALAAMAASNCLIEHMANAPSAAAGDRVKIHLIENGGSA